MKAFDLLASALPVHRQALDKASISTLRGAFAAWLARGGPGIDEDMELVHFLQHEILEALDRYARWTGAFERFNAAYGSALSLTERRRLVLEFAAALGRGGLALRGDGRAFDRFFGPDAVIDRFRTRTAAIDRDLCLIVERLGHAVVAVLKRESVSESRLRRAWRELRVEAELEPLLAHAGDPRVEAATFGCLARSIRGLPRAQRQNALGDATLRFVYRSALETRRDVWIQTEALDLLAEMSPESFVTALAARTRNLQVADDFFVRARSVALIAEHVEDEDLRRQLIETAVRDPSPFVRQAVADVLPAMPAEFAMALIGALLEDPEPSVQARALTRMPLLVSSAHAEPLLDLLARLIEGTTNPLVTRLALETLHEIHLRLLATDAAGADGWRQRAEALCARVHRTAPLTRVRRWASQAGERLWLLADPRRAALHDTLAAALEDLPRGGRRRLALTLLDGIDAAGLGRILALLALDDHGFDVEFTKRSFHVIRGHQFRSSLWRILHELRHSATDKRQGFAHTTGRKFDGTLVAPSTVLCELARTNVPGEPLFIDDEDGWRPFLPLVDNMLGVLDRGLPADPVRIASTEGITEIVPPAGPLARLRARWGLTTRFAELAELRNWKPGDAGQNPDAFVAALQELGFRIRFRPHEWQDGEADERVRRFFPAQASLAIPFLDPAAVDRAGQYFYSLYQNTLGHLVLFLAGMSTLFFGQHLIANLRIRRARASIPMVIGGWGTRGKSGTERLKAALFNGLGYSTLSKTTGCEAMFIYSRPFGRAREMFLFRPYDKATIWEQANLLSISRGLGTQVFLWECMALTPSFVEILQRQWMRDDYATITNAYPDHEDIQGPAGVNIPEVIGNFIPRRSQVVTTEEFMLPILRSEARAMGSPMVEVGWREALQLTPDVLDRFPYDEHPYNIALVSALARILEIPQDFAVKEMADRVIADLGVLKTFPAAPIRQRHLEFVNGCSANERFGALGNWRRMGFDRQDPVAEPGTWISTVINNRADRVARSKVFASVLVADLAADVHVLIGTNLDGLRSYIEDAWAAEMGDFSLGEAAETPAGRIEALEGWLRRFRVPFEADHLAGRLDAMVSGAGIAAAPTGIRTAAELDGRLDGVDETLAGELRSWAARFSTQFEEARTLLDAAADPAVSRQQLERDLAAQLHAWFLAKLVVVEDSGATGEQVIDQIVAATPPGLFNRVMGMQNIKGTGLDFVYRWLAWDLVHEACAALLTTDARSQEQGRQALLGFQEFGLLAESRVRETLAAARVMAVNQSEAIQAQLVTIEYALDEALNSIRAASVRSSESSSGGNERWFDIAEQLLDSFDAVRRRRRANLIYRELVSERISPERAALELQTLTKRQKGGWLRKQMQGA